MKVNLFGKQADVKTEFVVIAAAVLILLGCLTGYALFRDGSAIIIEDGSADSAAVPAAQPGNIAGTEPDAESKAAPGANSEPASGTDSKTASQPAGNLARQDGQDTGPDPDAGQQIKVYVVGCVNNPGIVILEKGQVIDDAVAKAGGLTAEADAGSINMVYGLTENIMLYIKSKKEMKSEQAENTGNKPEKPAAGSPGKGAELIRGSGGSVEATGGSGETGGGSQGAMEQSVLVNINTADSAELDGLPGVGEATAREIIAFREKNGPFRKIEDIMKVPRIKQGRFDSIRDLITVN